MVIKVLIVDDHAFIRLALAELLAVTDDIHVVGTCADGSEVAAAVARAAPDTAPLDAFTRVFPRNAEIMHPAVHGCLQIDPFRTRKRADFAPICRLTSCCSVPILHPGV